MSEYFSKETLERIEEISGEKPANALRQKEEPENVNALREDDAD